MSQVKFLKIYGSNYNSYESFELDLVAGKTLVLGENLGQESSSNGVGKSSIYESLVYTLFKKYDRGNDPSRNGMGNCKTGVVIDIGGKIYTIERYYKDPEFGNTSKLFIDGEDISARITSSTDEEIQRLIPIPYELFISTCVVLQGLPVNFTQLTPSVRKSVIENILEFSIWDTYRAKVTKKIKETSASQSAITPDYESKKSKMVEINAKISGMDSSNSDSIKMFQDQISAFKGEIRQLKQEIVEVISKGPEGTSEDNMPIIRTHITAIQSLNNAASKFEDKVERLESTIKDAKCPTCDGPYSEEKIKSAKDELKFIQGKIEHTSISVEMHRKDLARIEEIQSSIGKIKTTISSKMQLISSHQSSIDSINAKAKADNEGLQETLKVLHAETNKLNDQLKKLSQNQESLQFIDSLLVPSSTFRTQVLAGHLEQINKILRAISPLIFNKMNVFLSVNPKATGIDLNLKRGGRPIDYKQLSGGEKRRIDVAIILSFQRFLMESSGVKTNLLVLDEIFDALDRQGVDGVLTALDSLFGHDMQVYVITHNDSVKDRFERLVRIVKKDGVSRIENQ